MNTLSINDLNCSEALDRTALTDLIGGNAYHLRSTAIYSGGWSGYSLLSKQYQYLTVHDGAYARKYSETWLRTRTQYEYSYWDHYVRV